MQESVGTALYGFSKGNCLWGWLVSNLSELSVCVPYQYKRGPRLLPGLIIATAMQMLKNFVLSSYRPAWDRGNKLSLKRAGVYAFYQDCLIVFCVKCSIRILAHWVQIYQFWFLSEMVCHGNLWNKSQTFWGGFISHIRTCPSGLCGNDAKPCFLSLSERTCLWRLPSYRGVREAPRRGRYIQWN